jgi:hypothetical protein
LPLPPAVQWHGNNQVGCQYIAMRHIRRGQPECEWPGQARVRSVFELMNDFLERLLERTK